VQAVGERVAAGLAVDTAEVIRVAAQRLGDGGR
jgi:hypothetical protein